MQKLEALTSKMLSVTTIFGDNETDIDGLGKFSINHSTKLNVHYFTHSKNLKMACN